MKLPLLLLFITNLCATLGLSIGSKQSRFLVGGIQSGELPYQVSLQDATEDYDYGIGTGHFCSGAVISLRTVLTAAHCLVETSVFPPYIRSPSNINVVMGITNLYIPTSVTIGFSVSAFVYNTDFNTFNYNNDIAMLLINGEIPMGDFAIYPISMPTSSIPVNSSCTVSGWGATYQNGPNTQYLMSSTVPIVSSESCSQAYNESLPSGVICAGYFTQPAIPVDSCQGDSGGPLVFNNTLYGIVSWGEGCGVQGFPGIYTDVLYFQNWINATNNTLWNKASHFHMVNVCFVFLPIFFSMFIMNY
ncbi:hypothetical protein ACFFRR_001432 [Megaselia abdita]